MRGKDKIRDEVRAEWRASGKHNPDDVKALEREVDRRFHWERIVAEAEAYEREYGPVRIEFMAAPDDEICRRCWQMNGQSLSLDELKANPNLFGCRCAIVLPTEE